MAGSGLTNGSYCIVDDVCNAFPQFRRNANSSISDTVIQRWIDGRKARIRSALLDRGYDPDTATLTPDQGAFLRILNADGAIADLGDALQGTVTLQPGEYSLAAARRSSFERVLKEIVNAVHDSLFQPSRSRTGDPTPLFKGIGGAEVDPAQTPATANQTRFFGRGQIF